MTTSTASLTPAASNSEEAGSRGPLRHGIWAIPIFGVLTLWATFTHQPSPTDEFGAWARYVTTDAFLAQHLLGSIVGQAIFIVGAASLAGLAIADGRRVRAAVGGFVLAVFGAAGLLAGFGTAAFAQPAIGRLEIAGTPGAHALHDDVYGPAAFAVLLGGALLFSISSILLARAAAALAAVPRWAVITVGAAGPLIGILGVAVGPLQTLGSLAAIAGGTGLAWALGHPASAPSAS